MPLDFLLDRFDELPATRALLEQLPAAGKRAGVGGLPGSSAAVLVATLVRRLPQRLFAVVAPTPAPCIPSASRSAQKSPTTSWPVSESRRWRRCYARGGGEPYASWSPRRVP